MYSVFLENVSEKFVLNGLKAMEMFKMQILSQVKAVNQEFVSFMSPPSVNLSPHKFDLLGQPRSRQPKRKGNTACLLVTRFIGNTELNEKPIQTQNSQPKVACLLVIDINIVL